jgi:hypothetical protein
MACGHQTFKLQLIYKITKLVRNKNLNLMLQRGGAAVSPGDWLQGGGPHPAEGEGAALHAPPGAAAPGPLRPLLGAGVGRLLRGHRVQHQGVIYLQGESSDGDSRPSTVSYHFIYTLLFHFHSSIPFVHFCSIFTILFHFYTSVPFSQFYSICTLLFRFHSSI